MPDTILKHIPGMKTAAPVPMLNADDLRESEFLGKYVSNSQPCVIKGAIKHWAAMQKWRDRQYLKSQSGYRSVFYYPHENHITFNRMMVGKREMCFADAIDQLHCDQTTVASLGLKEDFPELRPDISGFPFLTKAEPSFLYPPIRYFFYRNAGSAWHFHPLDETLMCQVVGSKQIGLLSTNTPFQNIIKNIFLSEKYYDDPSEFDDLAAANLCWFSATVEDGDALYIPPLWWHGVIAGSNSFGVTAAVPWRSPSHVIAETIMKMAAGTIDLMGSASSSQLQSLIDVAKKIGLEQELATALKRAQVVSFDTPQLPAPSKL